MLKGKKVQNYFNITVFFQTQSNASKRIIAQITAL